jgi:hypothetical protein
MNMNSWSLEQLLYWYANQQQRLCVEAVRQFPKMLPALIGAPKRGELQVDTKVWRFQRHGAGFEFTSETGEIIDAHDDFEPPFATFDAWRLTLFFESLMLEELSFSGERFPLVEEREVRRLLTAAECAGVICRERERWFVLAAEASPPHTLSD